MKNSITDDITYAKTSSDCQEKKASLMGQMKEVGG